MGRYCLQKDLDWSKWHLRFTRAWKLMRACKQELEWKRQLTILRYLTVWEQVFSDGERLTQVEVIEHYSFVCPQSLSIQLVIISWSGNSKLIDLDLFSKLLDGLRPVFIRFMIQTVSILIHFTSSYGSRSFTFPEKVSRNMF